MTAFHTDDKVTVRIPCRIVGHPAWVEEVGWVAAEREITPGIQLWIECVGVERATVREADGNRFEVDLANLVAW